MSENASAPDLAAAQPGEAVPNTPASEQPSNPIMESKTEWHKFLDSKASRPSDPRADEAKPSFGNSGDDVEVEMLTALKELGIPRESLQEVLAKQADPQLVALTRKLKALEAQLAHTQASTVEQENARYQAQGASEISGLLESGDFPLSSTLGADAILQFQVSEAESGNVMSTREAAQEVERRFSALFDMWQSARGVTPTPAISNDGPTLTNQQASAPSSDGAKLSMLEIAKRLTTQGN